MARILGAFGARPFARAFGAVIVPLAAACALSSPVLAQTTQTLAQTTQTMPAAPSAADPSRQGAEPRPSKERGSGPFLETVPNDLMRVSKIVGIGVIGQDPVRIGTIDEIVMTREGGAVAVVIGTGGFLGMGEKRIAVPFEAVLWNTADGARKASTPDVVTAGTKPADVDSQKAAESMPGAKVATEALNAQNVGQSGKTDAATGPVTGNREGPPATETVVGAGGGATHAQVHMTRGDLELAPAFRYAGEGARSPGQRRP